MLRTGKRAGISKLWITRWNFNAAPLTLTRCGKKPRIYNPDFIKTLWNHISLCDNFSDELCYLNSLVNRKLLFAVLRWDCQRM